LTQNSHKNFPPKFFYQQFSTPKIFLTFSSKENEADHPLQRGLNFLRTHPDAYLFAKEHTSESSGSHYYEAWDLDQFFKKYQNENPYDRIYGNYGNAQGIIL
jgi:hypothetical protein